MLDFSKRLDPKRPLIHPTSRVKRCARRYDLPEPGHGCRKMIIY